MASSLSKQLANIAAHSTKPLDLRAKRDAHSQSLLFEKKVAATQDFDTIYDYCITGFQELCRLEPEFLTFSNTIFSEASKSRERGQLTAAENATLDTILDRFLTLSCRHLLLQPTQKAVEWLVRRFRVHEMNVESLVLTFLVYHPLPIFPTLLSILPRQLPRSLRFLHPYRERLQPLPGDVLQHATNTNSLFFDAWCGYVLKSCRWNYQHEPMLSYWTIRVASAVEAQLEATKIGNARAQRDEEENVVRSITNIIDKCLAFRQIPSMIVGCYIIIERLVLAANLSDNVISTFMDAIVKTASPEVHNEALVGLAVLAQQRKSLDISPTTLDFLLRLKDVVRKLENNPSTTKLDRFPTALAMGLIKEDSTKSIRERRQLLAEIMNSNLLGDRFLLMVLRRTLESKGDDSTGQLDESRQFVLTVAQSNNSLRITKIMQAAILDSKIDGEFRSAVQDVLQRLDGPEEVLAIEDNITPETPSKPVVSWTELMPENTEPPLSYMAPEQDRRFDQLAVAFTLVSEDPTSLEKFLAAELLNKRQATSSPTFFSFFARFWCSRAPSKHRAKAVTCVTQILQNSTQILIIEALVPYILMALADSAKVVRVAAAGLVECVDRIMSGMLDAEQTEWDSQQFYGVSGNMTQLTPTQLSTTIQGVILPRLEESKMDNRSIQQSIRDCLSGSSSPAKSEKFKKSFRSALLSFLAGHIRMTPVLPVAFCLLNIVTPVRKVGHTSTFEALEPFLEKWALMDEDALERACSKEKLSVAEFCLAVVKVAPYSSTTGHKKLQSLLPVIVSQSFLEVVLDYVRELWLQMNSAIRSDWAMVLLEYGVLQSKGSLLSALALESLNSLKLPTDILHLFLSEINDSELDLENGSPSAKRRKTDNGTSVDATDQSGESVKVYLSRVSALFDLIRNSDATDRYTLFPGLFRILHDVQKSRSTLRNDLNQVQWLFLTCLREILGSTNKPELDTIDPSEIRVDLVIDILTTTTDPETQYAALRLLSSLAKLEPELIVHSMMPVFTFIGNNLLKQDNNQAAHVVNQIIDSVIPPLVASFRQQKGNTLAGVSGIISSFAAAFDHISSPQRLDLFAALIDKLGAADHLSILFMVLQDQHNDQSAAIEDFVSNMFSRYPATVQIKTIRNCLDILTDSFETRPQLLKQIFAAERHKGHEERLLLLATLAIDLLQTAQFIPKVAKVLRSKSSDAEAIRLSYTEMVRQSLGLTLQQPKISRLSELIATIVSTLTGSFPVSESLQTLNAVLQQGNEELHRKVLLTFQQAIDRAQPGDKKSCEVCFDVLPSLSSVAIATNNSQVKQNAIHCINSIVRTYGKVDTQKTLETAQFMAGILCLQSTDFDVKIAALGALATMIAVLQEEILPVCPTMVTASLDLLAANLTGQNWNSNLHNAILSMFNALLTFIPWIVTGDKLDRLLELSYISASNDSDIEEQNEALTLLAGNTDAQSLFLALRNSWGKAVDAGNDAVREHLRILELAVEKHTKSTIAANSSVLTDHVTQIMALRTSHSRSDMQDWEEADVVEVEETASSILIKMIYKLNDAHFRPLFIKMSEWATVGKDNGQFASYDRLASWFVFLHKFFSTLESIVVSYAAYIQDAAIDVLREVSPQNAELHFLWHKTILTLGATFEHDQDDFWKVPARFSEICSPLIAQLEQVAADEDRDILIPCLTSFAVAVESAEHRAEIHKQVLNHFKSDKSQVRRNMFTCQIALTEALGEEWISLFDSSATYPIMSEAFEDDYEEVENEARKWKIQIEDITGESLDSRLQ